ncbi:MAG: twin-arginine translocase TatA/TatE family subunit [Ammonifex sp.]|jgi:TatA/E family protein of Tat protein translocase|nr:MAG: twin-arginine translocase TatA/TatE family subunit [Ammonifex sp.]
MFPSIGGTELILVVALALIIFGPSKLPEVGRSLGKTIREFRRSTRELGEDVIKDVKDVKDEVQEVKDTLKDG